MLDWEGLFKRYVWDDRTTPYLVPLSKLNRRQADNEILIYSLFVGVLFGIVAITALSDETLHGRSPVAPRLRWAQGMEGVRCAQRTAHSIIFINTG